MKIAGNIPATHVQTPQMISFGFDRFYGFLSELKHTFNKSSPGLPRTKIFSGQG